MDEYCVDRKEKKTLWRSWIGVIVECIHFVIEVMHKDSTLIKNNMRK